MELVMSKSNFETFYEEVVGEPITLSDELWNKVHQDIHTAVTQTIETKASNISRQIYDKEYK